MDAFLVESIRIEPHTHMISVDGELVRVPQVLEYHYLPDAVRIVVPSVRTDQRQSAYPSRASGT
jgi:hypothetical protein